MDVLERKSSFPENYHYYLKRPLGEWPEECQKFRLKRYLRDHPDLPKDLTWDQYRDIRIKNIQERARLGRESWKKKQQTMSPEELAVINKKKNCWKNLTPEERVEKSKHMKEISDNFWNGMNKEERKEFGKYRWNLKSDEEKKIIIDRFVKGGRNYMASLSREEIMTQVHRMQEAYKKKCEEHPEFRERQIRLLRENNMKFWKSMNEEELKEFYRRRYENLSDEVKEKMKENLRKAGRYYYEHLSAKERSDLLGRNKLNIKFEKAFNESILAKDFHFETEYMVKYLRYNYKIWDYAIYDKSNNLVCVVDLDGEYFHGMKYDYNGNQSKEERDEKRGFFVPENCKVHIIEDNTFSEGFKELIKILLIDYESYIEELFKLYWKKPFPYPQYDHMSLIKSFKQLINLNCDKIDLTIRNREGDRLILTYHHSIYHAHTHNCVSPYDAWNDKKLLRKCIENRIVYRTYLNPNRIVQGFNVSKIAPKVSVFSAGRAKMLIYKYLNNYNTIFDPFSGFSGRMLATMSLGKQYIGQDISHIHIKESSDIAEFIKKSITNYPIEIQYPDLKVSDVMKSKGTYDCLFTCPPYGNKEVWKNNIESNKSCDEWIDICLNNFKCKKYLFVVDKTEKYKDYIVDEISNISHFGRNSEYVILINK